MQKLILLSIIIHTLAQNSFTSKETLILSPQPPLTGYLHQNLSTSRDGDKYWSQELNSDQLPTNVTEYGYGFWFRFLSTYPIRLWSGKNETQYFLARLTVNVNYTDQAFGDNILTLWQGQGYYYYTTCDLVDGSTNKHTQNQYPNDIEGLWTYIHYSHSQVLNRSVGFIHFANQQSGRIQQDVTHPVIKYFNLIIGGRQFIYSGFNGQIYNIKFRVDGVGNSGAFIDDLSQFYKGAGLIPNFDLNQLVQFYEINQTKDIQAGQGSQVYSLIGGGGYAFPKEYSVSGWFKWTGPYFGDFHMVFRLTINDQNNNTDNQKLGDTTLTVLASKKDYYRASTYSYTDMNGNGNPDYHQDLPHQGLIQQWHFIYFGYNKVTSKAYFYFQTLLSSRSQDFIYANHYLVNNFYFLLRDSNYLNYQGQEALININLGPGSYQETSSNYQTITNAFILGLNQFLNLALPNSTNSNLNIGIS